METDSGVGQAIEICPRTETDHQSNLNSHIRFLSRKAEESDLPTLLAYVVGPRQHHDRLAGH